MCVWPTNSCFQRNAKLETCCHCFLRTRSIWQNEAWLGHVTYWIKMASSKRTVCLPSFELTFPKNVKLEHLEKRSQVKSSFFSLFFLIYFRVAGRKMYSIISVGDHKHSCRVFWWILPINVANTNPLIISLKKVVCGGSKGGARDFPSLWVQIFSFLWSFRRTFDIFAHTLEVGAPSRLGNPWAATGCKIVKIIRQFVLPQGLFIYDRWLRTNSWYN